MKIFLLYIGIIISIPYSYSQEKIDKLLKKGIEYHDAGQYNKAIGIYKQILQIDSASVEAMYEISYSLLESGDYESAIEYCDKLIERDDKYAILAYNTKGSCLNYMGRTDEAIEVYKEGIYRYEEFPQLHYNLGLAYYAIQDYYKARDAFLETLSLNPDHLGSHLNLGRTMASMNKRVESLLSLYYFLLMEPDTDRSEWAYYAVQEQLYNLDVSESDYKEADGKFSVLLGENEKQLKKDDLAMGLFIKDTDAFFTVLNEINETTDPAEATVYDNYISFFKSLALRGYTDVFCYYISHPLKIENRNWLLKNESRVKDFARWVTSIGKK